MEPLELYWIQAGPNEPRCLQSYSMSIITVSLSKNREGKNIKIQH